MKEISYKDLSLNPMTMISETWWLITAGSKERGYNTMTASWGHLGSLWGHGKERPTAIVYVRPQRYTKQFIDREEYFTLTVMGDEYKKQLAVLGTKSGKDGNKIAEVGFEPMFIDDTTAIAGGELVFVCRKLYAEPLKEECFTDRTVVENCYPDRDFHTVYVGEIERVFVK